MLTRPQPYKATTHETEAKTPEAEADAKCKRPMMNIN